VNSLASKPSEAMVITARSMTLAVRVAFIRLEWVGRGPQLRPRRSIAQHLILIAGAVLTGRDDGPSALALRQGRGPTSCALPLEVFGILPRPRSEDFCALKSGSGTHRLSRVRYTFGSVSEAVMCSGCWASWECEALGQESGNEKHNTGSRGSRPGARAESR
jgi:hypothetical protein